MKRVATIILNRNLKEPTEQLYDFILTNEEPHTDIYILEAGSDPDKLAKDYTWHANEKLIVEQGLRYPRGMNYALLKLKEECKYDCYEYFFLLTNDTELCQKKTLAPMIDIMDQHNKLGILSPCSHHWGEKKLLSEKDLLYFWHVQNNALLLRREFINSVCNTKPNYINFLFDGANFRGFQSETELIAKGYANDWATAITTKVYTEENESYLLEKSDLIKTESYSMNLQLYLDEGREWLRNKYGFNSRWDMQLYSKGFYDRFFEYNEHLWEFKL